MGQNSPAQILDRLQNKIKSIDIQQPIETKKKFINFQKITKKSMTLLCFLLDLRTISRPLLIDLKQSLLQLANLYAASRGRDETDRCKDEIPMLRDLIGLCYIQSGISPSSPPELKIAYRPGQSFSLRDFHHAVNNLPMNCVLSIEPMPSENDNQEVSLTNLLNNKALYAWGGDDITKKVIAISPIVFTNNEAFRKSLLDAAEHCVTVEFIIMEQEDINLYNAVSDKLGVFLNSLHELENCVLHRYLPDSWVLCGLVKRWLHELRNDVDEPLQAIFLFKNNIAGSVKQISCYLTASSNQIIDGFTPCQTCRCHGYPTSNAISNEIKGSFCPLTRRELLASDLIETAVRVGERTFLLLPSFEGSPKLRRVSAPINFNIIERTNLATLNEGVILGTSYVVTPAFHELDAASDECDKPELNAQIFHGLCGALFHLDQGLVCSSTCNTETMVDGAFHCFYLLQPSDRGPMLLRRLAGGEEVLPSPDMGRLSGLVIPEDIRNSINASLSLVELRDYNPLQHERSFHRKMNWLVMESLRLGSFPQRSDMSPERHIPTHQQVSNLQQPQSVSVSGEIHCNPNKDESTSSCISEWEQLLIVDEMNDDYSLASISKPKVQNSTSTQSRPLDDKTSRILERLEAPKQLKPKVPSPSIAASGQLKKPLLPLEPSSTQPIRPHFQKLKRKR